MEEEDQRVGGADTLPDDQEHVHGRRKWYQKSVEEGTDR